MHCTHLQPFTEGPHQALGLITDLNLLVTGRNGGIIFVALYVLCVESYDCVVLLSQWVLNMWMHWMQLQEGSDPE